MQPAPSDVRPVLRISTAILKPWPRSPRTWEAGTRTFSSSIGTVEEPFRPSFFSSFPGWTPPRSFVTAKAVIRRCSSDGLELHVLCENREELREAAVRYPVLGAVQDEGVGLLVVDGGRADRGRIRPGLGLGQGEGGDHLARRELREPLPLLFLRAVEQQALQADRLVAADQDPEGGVGAADLFRHAAVRRGRESVAAVRLRNRHTERAELRQPADDLRGHAFLPLDAGRVHVVAREAAERVEKRGDRLVLRGVHLGKRKHGVLGNRSREQRLDDGNEAALASRAIVAHGSISREDAGESGKNPRRELASC